MAADPFTVLVALGAGAAAIRLAWRAGSDLAWRWRNITGAQRRKWAAAAAKMRLPLAAEGFGGTIRGFRVEARRSSAGKARQVQVVVRGNSPGTEIPPGLRIAPRGVFEEAGQPVGDPDFDARYSVAGDPATILALFGAETRRLFMSYPAGETPFTVVNGELAVLFPDRVTDDPERIVETATAALRLAERLSLRPEAVPAALLRNARQDPLRAVRVRSLEALADARVRETWLLEELRGMIGDYDPQVRLHAGRGLGAEGFAPLAGLVTSTRTPPEVAARALTVVAAPPGYALDLFAPPAEIVPLIRRAVTAPSWELRIAGLYALAGQAEAAAARGERLEALRAPDLERAALAVLGSDAEERLQAAVAALAAMGTADAVLPLRALAGRKRFSFGLGRSVEDAVDRIQARLHGPAAAGRVMLAPPGDEAGRVSLAGGGGAGRIALAAPETDRGRPAPARDAGGEAGA